MSNSYKCRVCARVLALEADIQECPGCLAKEPWKTDAALKADAESEMWKREEKYHADQYMAYIGRFLGTLRFSKQISHHVDKANEAQRKWHAIRGLEPPI